MKTITFLLALLTAIALQAQTISGKWYTSNEQEEFLTLLPNGYFKVQWGVENEFLTPETGWGVYEYDGQQLVMQYFNGTLQQYDIRDHTSDGFLMYEAQSGKHWQYAWQEPGRLNRDDQIRLQSEINFHRLTGTWQSDEETLKFMGNGIVIVVSEQHGSQIYQYSTLANILRIKNMGEEVDNFFYTARISNFSRAGFSLTGKDGETTEYLYRGKLKLSSYEQTIYMMWLQTLHRVNMTAIDAIDGVQDFIWKRVDENGNIIH